MIGKVRKPKNEKQIEQIPLKDLSKGTLKKMAVFFWAVLLSTLFVCRYSGEHGKYDFVLQRNNGVNSGCLARDAVSFG